MGEAAFDWKHPNYDAVFADRVARLKNIRENPEILKALKDYYAEHPADFCHDWMVTLDPRNVEIGLPSKVPFLLFPKQREFIEFLYSRWRGREDGLCEKSRDMGVSWLCVAFGVWMWIFHAETVIGFGSRKEEYVDDSADPKALLWKARELIDSLPAEFRPRGYVRKVHAPFMKITNPANDAKIVGEAGDNIGRGARTSMYFKDEAQPLDAKVLTPSGWSRMGDMRVGSVVYGPDGLTRSVTRINDAGEHPVYRVGFSDGTSAQASHNHLWVVDNVWGKRAQRILRTHELADTFRYDSPGGQTQYRYRLPAVQPIQFPECTLPLDPYLIGCLLGDGHIPAKGTITLTSADDEIVESVEAALPAGCRAQSGEAYEYRLSTHKGSGRTANRFLHESIESLGMRGHNAPTKSIPLSYKFSSVADRIALLQGLMDTDGSASGGVASYHTCSSVLAEDVKFVVNTLGGTATVNVKPDRRGYRDMYVLHIALPGFDLFRLSRKLDQLSPRKHPVGRTVISVDYVGEKTVRCITVDAPDGLYLTDDCIVTHNSAFYDRPGLIDAALASTSNCKIDVSTPNGAGNPFYLKRHSGKIPVFSFLWTDDPRKDKEWYERQVQTLDPIIVAQEIDCNYEASVVDSFLPGEIVMKAMQRGPKDVEARGPVIWGVDVARFGDDSSVLVQRQGRVVTSVKKWQKVDTQWLAQEVWSQARDAKITVDQIAVDDIGVGGGVSDRLAELAQGSNTKIERVNASIRVSDGRNYNVRTKMWDDMREWLEDEPVSIPNDPQLKAELTALRYKFRSGVRLLESKDEAKRRGIKSPDIADALALTFAKPMIKAYQPVRFISEFRRRA